MNATIIRKHLVLLAGGGLAARGQDIQFKNEGTTIGVSFRSEKGTIRLGEPISVVFEVRNPSNETELFRDGPSPGLTGENAETLPVQSVAA